MTAPSQDPTPQWGTGLPGIPSMWDTAPVAVEPSSWPTPAPHTRRERRRARRWPWVGLGLLALAIVSSAGTYEEDFVGLAVPEAAVSVPEPVLPGPGEPGVPLPPPGPAGVVPAPEAYGGLVAQRADGAGEPFGLALGTPVVLTDAAARSQLDVAVLFVTRSDGRLLVDLEMSTPTTTGGTLVPALLLRLPDGRELGHAGVSDGQDVPQVLGQGLLWRGTLVFDAAPASGALVLDDGRALAGWAVPAG